MGGKQMKISRLVGDRYREKPSDSVIESHSIMLRGGYIKNVANGIFSLYTPLLRITRKIEQIIREEMDAIDGQEVLFPVVLPGGLWEKSGRYASTGSELVRFKDRNNSPLILAMTHEEAAVSLVSEYGQSYARYPFMVYQIQTKFRDEARPRAGLIRTREFTMKDAYSFHTSQNDLEIYYDRCRGAYERIFARTGIPDVIEVLSDPGMMGGNVSHEYMLLTAAGEDSVAVCNKCGYRANVEAAQSMVKNSGTDQAFELQLVHTPGAHTIEEVCGLLGIPHERSCKAVVFQRGSTDGYVVLFIRGDMDVNETKLANHLKDDIRHAVITDDCGLTAGSVGPYGFTGDAEVVFDRSLEGSGDLLCGANIAGYHYTGLQIERDCGKVEYHDLAKIKSGGICPICFGRSVEIMRGIEVGNIFQLGDKYTKAMEMTYLDKDGKRKYPVMGCYGIGIGRLAATVCERHHDAYGPVWPASIAPWQVHLCCVRSDDAAVKACADALYSEMQGRDIDVIYDDRNISAGTMFSDADLLGVPIRVIVSPRNMENSCCEIAARDKTYCMKVSLTDAVKTAAGLIVRSGA
jgi:prolyl-tRNA synthetase